MAAGWYSGPIRWLLGRWGKPGTAPAAHPLCGTAGATPRLTATASVSGPRFTATAGAAPRLTATASAEVC